VSRLDNLQIQEMQSQNLDYCENDPNKTKRLKEKIKVLEKINEQKIEEIALLNQKINIDLVQGMQQA
jgi:hypothetical protein